MIRLIFTSTLFRKALFLSALGFAAVVLIGPILAVAGVVLAFAIIGLITWPLVRLTWGTLARSKNKGEQPEARPVAVRCGKPLWTTWRPRCARACRWVGEQARFTGGVVLEVVCGALLGGMVGLLAGRESPFVEEYVGIGALIGVFAGIIVGKTGRHSGAEAKVTA